MLSIPNRFNFRPVEVKDQQLVCDWLIQPHIAEWIHGVGLQNTLNLETAVENDKLTQPFDLESLPSEESFTIWECSSSVGRDSKSKSCITLSFPTAVSRLNGLEKFFQDESTTTYWMGYDNDIPFAFLITSPEGNDATTLDVFICDLNYLGKGIAVPMIQEFLLSQFSDVKRVLIDPEATNQRAIHVYKKVGFKITSEFIASWHPVPHYQMELDMENLLKVDK